MAGRNPLSCILKLEAVGKDQVIALSGIGTECFGLFGWGSRFDMADMNPERITNELEAFEGAGVPCGISHRSWRNQSHPQTAFIVTSGRRSRGNVSPLIFRLEEASYLAGMVAGKLSRTGVLGFVGGIELPPIKAAYQGWVNGAKVVNPAIRSREVYLNSFDDVAAGREAALALIGAGADMFHHNADAAALGLFQAVKQSRGVYVLGSNADQAGLAPDHVLGSAVIDLPRAFLLVASELKRGAFVPHVEAFGLESGVVRYVPNPRLDSLIPASLKSMMAAAAESLANGTLLAAPRPRSMEASAPTRSRRRVPA